MMDIKVQIISLLISFIYGVFFSNMIKINYNLIKIKNNIIKNIVTFIFILSLSLIYFIVLYKINNGIIHSYFVISLILGFIFESSNIIKKIKYLK